MATWQKWAIGVTSTVMAGVVSFLLLAWVGHFEAAAQTSRSASQTEVITERLVSVVEKLTDLHEAEDAGMEKVAELCRAGKLDDCGDCAEAGIELKKCKH